MIQRRTIREAVPNRPAAEILIPATGRLLEDIEREAVALTLKLTKRKSDGGRADPRNLATDAREEDGSSGSLANSIPGVSSVGPGSTGPPAVAALIERAQQSERSGQREIVSALLRERAVSAHAGRWRRRVVDSSTHRANVRRRRPIRRRARLPVRRAGGRRGDR